MTHDPIRTIARLICTATGADPAQAISVDGGADLPLEFVVAEEVRAAFREQFSKADVRMLNDAATELRLCNGRFAADVQAFAERLDRLI